MSHFKLIQLSKKPVKKSLGNYMVEEDLYEDPLLELKSDGWEVDKSKDALEAACYMLGKIGRCDMKKKTFTFMSKEELKKKYMESIEETFENWKQTMAKNLYSLGEYLLRTCVQEACDVNSLLYYENYCHSASSLITDYLSGYLPDTMYIGTIVDCHR